MDDAKRGPSYGRSVGPGERKPDYRQDVMWHREFPDYPDKHTRLVDQLQSEQAVAHSRHVIEQMMSDSVVGGSWPGRSIYLMRQAVLFCLRRRIERLTE